MKTNILLLFICVVCNMQCVYNNKQEYTRIKRAKYHYPSKFYKLPPSSSQIMGPFSYTPPPGYMSDSGPPPANLRGYKVSKKPNNGLGDEDIHNLFKYLSKQDLNKIVELAVEKNRLSEYRKPYFDNNNYEFGNSNYENQEQRPFYKDFDEDSSVQHSGYPVDIKDENMEYSSPNLNAYQDSLQRITRNLNRSPIDNFDYPKSTIKNNIPSSDNFDFSQVITKNYNNLPTKNFDNVREITRNYNNPLNENFDYPQENITPISDLNYPQGSTQNLNKLLNENIYQHQGETKIYNSPQISNFNYPQGIINNRNIPQTDDINYSRAINNNYNSPQNENSYTPEVTKNPNNLQIDSENYFQEMASNNYQPKSNYNSKDILKHNGPQNYNYSIRQMPGNEDLTSQSQILFLDEYIQKEMSKQRLDMNMYIGSTNFQDQSVPSPSNLRDQDYEISYTNNIPQVVNADNNSYKVENFADLPLMNYDSKLDTVNSYNVPHYTVTQVENKQKAAIQSSPLTNAAKPIIELAPPRSAGRDQSDAHLKAIRIWTHKSKGMAYTLHDDGTLSPERPIRPKFKSSP